MAQLSHDCFAPGAALLPLADAIDLITARVGCVAGREQIPLTEAAGRILAETLVAGAPLPPHDNSAVDGYLVHHRDLSPTGPTRLRLVGRAAAGHPFGGVVGTGEALAVYTGAPLPPGPDTIYMEEDCTEFDDGGPHVEVPPGLSKGANLRPCGEDISVGNQLLIKGLILRPQDIATAAALGCPALPVQTPLRVAVLSTGDELCEPGAERPHGAIYDANRFGIAAWLRRLGHKVTDCGILPDRRRPLTQALSAAAANHHLILSTGGMSVGGEDHVREALAGAGGQLHAWRLAIKPGRPVGLGTLDGAAVMGLPGNPAAAFVTFAILGLPLIDALSGATPMPPPALPVPLGFAYRKKAGRREYVRVRLTEGKLIRSGAQGAGILSALIAADGLAVLAEDRIDLGIGDPVPYIPFTGLLR